MLGTFLIWISYWQGKDDGGVNIMIDEIKEEEIKGYVKGVGNENVFTKIN